MSYIMKVYDNNNNNKLIDVPVPFRFERKIERDFAKQWLKDLKSGKYVAGTGSLVRPSYDGRERCCLGVAVDTINKVYDLGNRLDADLHRSSDNDEIVTGLKAMYHDHDDATMATLPSDWVDANAPFLLRTISSLPVCQQKELFLTCMQGIYRSAIHNQRVKDHFVHVSETVCEPSEDVGRYIASLLADAESGEKVRLSSVFGADPTNPEFANVPRAQHIVGVFINLNDEFKGWDAVIPFLTTLIEFDTHYDTWKQRVQEEAQEQEDALAT